MAPYPAVEPEDPPSWPGGPAVIPGVLLAAQHINCDNETLPEYQLKVIISDGGCNVRTRATVNFSAAVYLDKQKDGGNIVGIVGGACSESAFAVAELTNNEPLSLLQISPSATSPLFVTEREKYRNTIRLTVNALVFTNVFKEIILKKKYTEIAILHDSNRSYMVTVANEFDKVLRANNVTATDDPLSDTYLWQPLRNLRDKNRIIFVFAGGKLATNILCVAYRENMTYPNYQLIFINRRRAQLVKDVEIMDQDNKTILYKCTKKEMEEAIHTATLFEPRVTRRGLGDEDARIVSGHTFREYYCQYLETRKQHLADHNYTMADVIGTSYQNAYYDSTWALAKSLHNADQSPEFNLSTYRYGMMNKTQIILNEFFNVSFEGASGKVSFNNNTLDIEEVAIVDIFQEGNGTGESVRVANHTAENGLSISENFFILNESVFRKPPPVFIHPPAELGYFVISVAILVIIAIAVIHYLNGTLGELKVVKASSPQLNHLIFSGCYLLLLDVISYSCLSTIFVANSKPAAPNPVLFAVFCNTQVWVSTYSVSLIFGTICMKTWRIWRIFSHFSSSPIKFADDFVLVAFVVALIGLDTVYLLIWNSVDPLFMHIQGEDQRLAMCSGDNLEIWLSILLGYKALVIALVLYLSIRTRKVNKHEFKQTKSINTLIYLLLFVTVLGIVPYAIASASQTFDRGFIYAAYVLYSVAFVSVAVMCTIFVFLPPIYPTIKRKWRNFRIGLKA